MGNKMKECLKKLLVFALTAILTVPVGAVPANAYVLSKDDNGLYIENGVLIDGTYTSVKNINIGLPYGSNAKLVYTD